MVQTQGQRPFSAIQSAVARMAAFANVFPSTMVASKSSGWASSRATMPPLAGARSESVRACHLLSEKREVSASEKKKLAPAKTTITHTANTNPRPCPQDGARTGGSKGQSKGGPVASGLQPSRSTAPLRTGAGQHQRASRHRILPQRGQGDFRAWRKGVHDESLKFGLNRIPERFAMADKATPKDDDLRMNQMNDV